MLLSFAVLNVDLLRHLKVGQWKELPAATP
jgi:hypothetical protein